MKQIQRDGSPQRAICELLQRQPGLTINELAAARDADISATRRRLDLLEADGYVVSEGYPKRWSRTAVPVPPVVRRTPKAESVAQRRRREEEYFRQPFGIPVPDDLERVFLRWHNVQEHQA